MKIISHTACVVTFLASTFLSGQQVQNYSYSSPNSQVVTTTQVDPNYPPQGNVPGAPASLGQPGYQYTTGTVNQTITPVNAPYNPYASDYSYGESSVQYAKPIVPVKPYVPYSELTPASNAYPLYPYTSPQANQVNQQFMQRYSQQDQDYIRSQFGYPQTFKDPNEGKPPLGKPMRFTQPINTSKIKPQGKDGKQQLKPMPINRMADTPTYLFPGMVGLSKRLWVGSDYLFYLQKDIGVVIELIADKQVKSDEGKILVEESKLKAEAELIFKNAGINPQSFSIENTPPLPFFHILIMMYHADSKIFASVSGRLFEDALPARLDLDSPVGTFQAITWEKNEILITSAPQFPEQIELMIKNISSSFVDRYRYFAEEEIDANSSDVLRSDFDEEEDGYYQRYNSGC